MGSPDAYWNDAAPTWLGDSSCGGRQRQSFLPQRKYRRDDVDDASCSVTYIRRQQVEATTTVNNDRRRQQQVEATATVNNDRPVPPHSARRSSTRESYVDSDQKCLETICTSRCTTRRRTTTKWNSRAFPGGSNAHKTDIRRSPSVDILEMTFVVSPRAPSCIAIGNTLLRWKYVEM